MCMWRACAVASSQVTARRDGHRIGRVARQIWQGAHWRCVVTVDDIISLRCRCLVQLGPFDWRPRDLQGLRRHEVYSNILWATRNWGRRGGGGAKISSDFRVCCSWNNSWVWLFLWLDLLKHSSLQDILVLCTSRNLFTWQWNAASHSMCEALALCIVIWTFVGCYRKTHSVKWEGKKPRSH